MIRLQKVLADAGIASRRKSEDIILAGRVEVNDKIVTTLGTKVDPDVDFIKVDGKPIRAEKKVYILFHKPKGVITTTHDPEGRRIVTDLIKGIEERLVPVGRLDYDTEGLLLLTNDGHFVNVLTHPKYEIPKVYHATVNGVPHGDVLERLRQGIKLDDGMTYPAEVEYVDVEPDHSQSIIAMTIHEGRNRQVRRMFDAVSFPVQRLRRVQLGDLTLHGVGRGRYRHLTTKEVNALLNMGKTHNSHKKI